jgi:hypothetical protein
MKGDKGLILFGDTHVGSTSAVCPPGGLIHHDGQLVKPTKYQRTLIRYWDHAWNKWIPEVTKGVEIGNAVHMGDIIDGVHHNTTYLMSNSWERQEEAGINLLRPIKKNYDLWLVRGTESHSDHCGASEERIGKALDTKKNEVGEYTNWQWWFVVNEQVIQCAHHIGTTSSAAYETSAPMREMVTGLVEAAQWKRPLPKVFVRAHRHRYINVPIPQEDDDIMMVITPAWQVRTPHVEKFDRMRMPHIGIVVLIVKEDGQCEIKRKLYPLPKPRLMKI